MKNVMKRFNALNRKMDELDFLRNKLEHEMDALRMNVIFQNMKKAHVLDNSFQIKETWATRGLYTFGWNVAFPGLPHNILSCFELENKDGKREGILSITPLHYPTEALFIYEYHGALISNPDIKELRKKAWKSVLSILESHVTKPAGKA